MQLPRICRIVEYRSRTGSYTVPAIINCTAATLAPQGVELYEQTDGAKGTPPLSSVKHVHLTVFTPGVPGEYDTPLKVPAHELGLAPNLGGSYQEWDVPYDSPERVGGDEQMPGTWRWPARD